MDKTCKTCKFWQPKFRSVGKCAYANSPNAAFWVTAEDSELLVVSSHCCMEHKPIENAAKDVI